MQDKDSLDLENMTYEEIKEHFNPDKWDGKDWENYWQAVKNKEGTTVDESLLRPLR